MDLIEIKGTSGGRATYDPASGAVIISKRRAEPTTISLLDVIRFEFTLPRAMKPGHIRFFTSLEQPLAESQGKDPFALVFTSYPARHDIAAWIQTVVDAYIELRPDGTVEEANSWTLRGSIRQTTAEARKEIREITAEARKELSHPAAVTIPTRPPADSLFTNPPAAPAAPSHAEVPAADMRREEETLELIDVPRYSMIAVTDLGSTDGISGITATVGEVLVLWTAPESDENPFVGVKICGVLNAAGEMSWLPDDARVEVVAWPRYPGKPEDLARHAKPMTQPAGTKGVMKTGEGVHPLIWNSSHLSSIFNSWTDPEISVMELLCALNVALNDPFLQDQLLATLKARWSSLSRNPGTYPPESYPWRHGDGLRPDDLDYLRGRH